MRTFLMVSAIAALLTSMFTSCGNDTASAKEKELVYEGKAAEPQIGEQHIVSSKTDTVTVK
ncbi:hypothetical protein LRS05_11790 [Flavobacterium sp. J372]|uniref:hypothetical protein n=1 Tax=Flavobacterium sp. J372 TaxID=2898436 RepID=UPI002150BC3D|nr:hypothetical protein [Flavobacterium sp. J372]MCR5862777.1 hypothetical protein [Flavobacterium sp. J372]